MPILTDVLKIHEKKPGQDLPDHFVIQLSEEVKLYLTAEGEDVRIHVSDNFARNMAIVPDSANSFVLRLLPREAHAKKR